MTLAVECQIDLRWTDLIERERVNSLERRMAVGILDRHNEGISFLVAFSHLNEALLYSSRRKCCDIEARQ